MLSRLTAFGLILFCGALGRAQTDLLKIESSQKIAAANNSQFVIYSPDSTEIAVGGPEGVLIYGILPRAHNSSMIRCPKGKATAGASSQDGSMLAVGCDDGSVLLSRWDGSAPTTTLGRHTKRVTSLAFAPNNPSLLTAGQDKAIILWDTNTSREVEHFETGAKRPCVFVGFSDDGQAAVGVTDDGEIIEWDSKSGHTLLRTTLEENSVFSARLNVAGNLLAVGGEFAGLLGGTSSGRAISSGNQQPEPTGPARASVGWGPTGGINPAAYYRDERILVFDLRQGKIVKQIPGLKGQLRDLSISRDNRYLAATVQKAKGTYLSVYDLDRGVEILSEPSKDRVPVVGFSPSGKYLAQVDPGGDLIVLTLSGVTESPGPDLEGRRIKAIGPTSPILKPSPRLTLAIVDLESPKGKDIGHAVAESLRSAIVNAAIKVVTYDRMQEVIKQQNFEQSVRTDPTTAVALGKILNATDMLFGTVSALGSSYLISVHLVDVETAGEKGAREVQCDRCSDEDVPNLVKELVSVTVGPQ